MIHDSHRWKEPLLSNARWLETVTLSKRNWEPSLARAEKELFIGFYAIRKLLDTFKVSDKTKKKTFELKWFPLTKTVDYMNWHRIDEHFDLKSARVETRNIRFLCDQFVHS